MGTVILCVEDDDSSFRMLSIAIEEIDSSVLLYRAENGQSALQFLRHMGQYAQSPRPSLIFSDVNLPELNGVEFLTEVLEDEHLSSIPIVMLTSSPSDRDRCLSLGARDYFVKPMEFSALVSITKSALAIAA